MKRLLLLATALLLGTGRADATQIVITATAIEPAVLRVPMGERVDVEVVIDPQHPWESKTCGAIVMGTCIEP